MFVTETSELYLSHLLMQHAVFEGMGAAVQFKARDCVVYIWGERSMAGAASDPSTADATPTLHFGVM